MKSKFDVIDSDVHSPLAIQSHGGKRNCIMFIDQFSRYTWIYVIRYKSEVKMVYLTFYDLVEIQWSAKIKKLKTHNRGEYVYKELTTFLEIKDIIHVLSPPFIYQSNSLHEHINHTIVTMLRLMTLDCADVIPQGLWAEADSSAIHIKNRLPDSTFKLTKLRFKIMFGAKPSFKHLYPFGAKCYVHIPEWK
jgi:hypothetical protein